MVCRQECAGQIYPKEGSELYYRLIGFSFPAQSWAVRYGVEIAQGNYTDAGVFEKNISQRINSRSSKIIGEVPFFGVRYTWRIVFVTKDSGRKYSILYHFSTRTSPDVDSTVSRLRVTKAAEKYKDAYVFLDGTRVLYDMNGKPIWFLPGSDWNSKEAYPRDLKLSPKGTITFTTGYKPYEINYDGKILWQYKSNRDDDITDSFHHEFTRMGNGHYMAMRYESVMDPLPEYKDSVARNARDSSRYFHKTKFSTIVEYDRDNNIVWRWRSYEYEHSSDLQYRKPGDDTLWNHDLHENSFYFDEAHKAIYLSFRNISRVIKIKYPGGDVLNTYGTLYKPGITEWGNALFCMQHSCRVNDKGDLYVFNNNTCGTPPTPKVELMQQPAGGKGELKKIWEYQCTIDDPAVASENPHFHSGGNVLELPDQSMFVSMSAPYCKVFIVGHDKKILWSAVPEKYYPEEGKWKQPPELYRASIVRTRKELEELIWNSEKE